jgi:hypothetical protein
LLLLLLGVGTLLMVEGADPYYQWPLLVVNGPVFATVGAVIVAKRPAHPIGWLLAGIGLAMCAELAIGQYAVAALAVGTLPRGAAAAWMTDQLALITLAAIVFVLLLFPTGRLPSAGWRPIAGLAVVGVVSLMVRSAFTPGPSAVAGYENPFGVPALVELVQAVGRFGAPLFFGSALAAILSLVVRFRDARGIERQQLKWLVYAVVVAVVLLLLVNGLLADLTNEGPLGDILWGAAVASVAVAVAVAVLRYRLYDIDRIVNRTLVYGALTALLSGFYTGVALVLGQLFGGLRAEPPAWAVASATLAAAALFQPARRRIQAVVDRRFNRRRYDAARTVEAFAARLREQVDLDALEAELLAVVEQTVAPTRASLWLRPSAGSQLPT